MSNDDEDCQDVDDGDDVIVDEYVDISDELSDKIEQSEESTTFEIAVVIIEISIRIKEFKWPRVQKLCNKVSVW